MCPYIGQGHHHNANAIILFQESTTIIELFSSK